MFTLIKTHFFVFSILVIGLVLFLPTLSHGFVWDDEEQVVSNEAVHSFTNIPNLFAGSTFNSGGSGSLAGMYYKPMMSVAFAFLYSLSGGRAFLFHLFQISLHIANALMIYLIFKSLFAKEKYGQWLSWWTGLVFLVHPLNVETAVYISALQDVLYFFFGCLGLLLITRYRNLNNLILYPVLSCLLLLSLLSKETGIAWFFIIPIYYLLFDEKPKVIRNYSILASYVFIFYLFLRFGIAKIDLYRGEGISPIMRVDFWQRIISLPKILSYYLINFFFPFRLAIAQHWVVSVVNWSDFWRPLSFLSLIVVATGWLFRLIKGQKHLLLLGCFFTLWLLLGLGIHAQVFPLDMTVADRWFYFPMVGALGLMSLFLLKLFQKINSKKTVLFFSSLVILLLIIRSVIRIDNWQSGLSLFAHDITISTDAFDLENNYGVELFRVGEFDQAKKHFARSTEIAPYWWSNWNNLGVAYQREGDVETALEFYQTAMDHSDYYLAYQNYLGILIGKKRLAEAESFLREQALPKFPFNAQFLEALKFLESQNYKP